MTDLITLHNQWLFDQNIMILTAQNRIKRMNTYNQRKMKYQFVTDSNLFTLLCCVFDMMKTLNCEFWEDKQSEEIEFDKKENVKKIF